MSNKKQSPNAPVWRECYDITESGRLFVSSEGEVKFSLTTHHDEKTGRPYVLIDGRPIFIDSLSLSMFGDTDRPSRCYDITHLDADPDNCHPDNLEWTPVSLRNRDSSLSCGTSAPLSYLMQRTVTPEMVESHSYPIVNPAPAADYSLFDSDFNQDVHSKSSDYAYERPAPKSEAEIAQHVSDLEDRLYRRPKDEDEKLRALARMIAEDLVGVNPAFSSLRKVRESNSKKYLCQLDVPLGYTIVRRYENGRWIWYRVKEEVLDFIESIFSDVRSGKSPKDLLDIRSIKWRPYGKAEFEYLGDYIFDGNEISEEEFGLSDDGFGFNMKRNNTEMLDRRPEVNDIDKKPGNPVNSRFNTKRSFDLSNVNRTSTQNSEYTVKTENSDSCENVRDTSADERSMKISLDELEAVRGIVESEYKTGMKRDETAIFGNETEMEILELAGEKIKANDEASRKKSEKFDSGLSIEQLDEISEGLKQLTPTDLKNLRQVRGDLVQNERGGKGKPVVITDMRNMRKFYSSSLRECAELLGVEEKLVSLAVRGKIRQVKNYQITLLNTDDGIFILQGLYKKYMDMLEKKRQELADKDEDKKLEEELADINSEINRMMSEKKV